MVNKIMPPTESTLMAKIDIAIAVISIGVITTCAITLAVLSTLPNNSSSNTYRFGNRIGYGYGYNTATVDVPPTAADVTTTLTTTTPPFPESDTSDSVTIQY